MASGHISAFQVGSYFVGQYYQVLQGQPELVHQFYNEPSTMIRVDGDSSEVASTILDIHTIIMSLDFTGIEIKTINSLDSWSGGVLVMVTGLVKTREFSGKRKFAQSFFLAPQEKGYFVLNDIFQFVGEELDQHDPSTIPSEKRVDADINVSSALQEAPVTDYAGEEAATEYVDSLNTNDDPLGQYYVQDQHWNDPEPVHEVYEAPFVESAAPHHQAASNMQDHTVASVEEAAEEPQKKTYASILRLAKEQAQQKSVAAAQPSGNTGVSASSEWDYTPQPPVYEQTYVSKPSEPAATEEVSILEDDVEFKSVYVRNLPFSVTSLDLEQEFQNFGRIIPDGIFIRSRPETGVCYAFVEFEDLSSVHSALQASPIQLGGNKVYIEERRANPASIARGGRRGGRGRMSYPGDASRGRFGGRGLGRGNYQDSVYGRQRGNGFYPRG
uniref:G3BP-like protein n=1 Tax=Kalanchoe fedtschenkoi TaxID=63787 RepID=A0A7N0U4S1_KALFE